MFLKAWKFSKKLLLLIVPNTKNKAQSNYKRQVAPKGFFPVYVGPQRQRFVIKIELANHPLFKVLLKEAEMKHGFDYGEGPIWLACEVDLFYKVLAEMDSSKELDIAPATCKYFTKGDDKGGYRLLSPLQMLKINQF
ncbi:Auxin-responsive protein [Quillaja saponaria]|uniref:Auxin-responsive protein n=1 Tax=Quillaja saponaria TaxID=32244 RepID=A0AAD7KTD4_QUISA|nr:Auxin-responsive protein [Quillaja saponaria]